MSTSSYPRPTPSIRYFEDTPPAEWDFEEFSNTRQPTLKPYEWFRLLNDIEARKHEHLDSVARTRAKTLLNLNALNTYFDNYFYTDWCFDHFYRKTDRDRNAWTWALLRRLETPQAKEECDRIEVLLEENPVDEEEGHEYIADTAASTAPTHADAAATRGAMSRTNTDNGSTFTMETEDEDYEILEVDNPVKRVRSRELEKAVGTLKKRKKASKLVSILSIPSSDWSNLRHFNQVGLATHTIFIIDSSFLPNNLLTNLRKLF